MIIDRSIQVLCRLLLVSIMIFNISCVSTCAQTCPSASTTTTSQPTDGTVVKTHAFAMLKKHNIYIGKSCPPNPVISGHCVTDVDDYNGSGIFVYRSKASPSVGFLISAAHVCTYASHDTEDYKKQHKPEHEKKLEFFEVNDYRGLSHQAHPYFIQRDDDLCVLMIQDMDPDMDYVELATSMPPAGSRTYTMSAPKSFFNSHSVLIFEGLYAGRSQSDKWEIYSLPVAPGSSGSGVIDQHGQLLSMIMGMPLTSSDGNGARILENIAYAVPKDVIERAVKSIETADEIFGITLLPTSTTSHR